MEGTSKDVYDATGKGTFSANGVTPMFAKPVAPEGTANRNQMSLRPGGGLAGGEATATKKKKDQTEEDGDESMKENIEFDISDYIETLFEGQDLSEEFKQKAAVVFESALNQKISIIEQAILEASEELIEEQVVDAVNVLTEKVDDYLGYVITEWMDENRLEVEQGFRTEIAENFISGLKDLFESSFIEVPESKVDLVDELFAHTKELEEGINQLMQQNMELQEKNLVNECATAFVELSSGLADTEVEKLMQLTEGIDFSDVETYKNKVQILKESYFGETSPTTSNKDVLTEEFTGTKPASGSGNEMDAYVSSISKHLKLTNKKV